MWAALLMITVTPFILIMLNAHGPGDAIHDNGEAVMMFVTLIMIVVTLLII